MPPATRRPWPVLTHEVIADHALALFDEHGMDALTLTPVVPDETRGTPDAAAQGSVALPGEMALG